LLACLEKVVCVPTSVHHIAGALGKRVEIITPPVKNKEAENLSPWDYSTHYNDGNLLWYSNSRVFEDVQAWKRSRAIATDVH
jgi:hypothetical protein